MQASVTVLQQSAGTMIYPACVLRHILRHKALLTGIDKFSYISQRLFIEHILVALWMRTCCREVVIEADLVR